VLCSTTGELASVRLLACGDLVAAHEREEWAMRSIVHILSTKPWPECRPLLEQVSSLHGNGAVVAAGLSSLLLLLLS
jgi:hypothetical protein